VQNGQIFSMSEGERPLFLARRAWRYQRGNQNPYIEEEQIRRCPKGQTTNIQNKHIKLKIE